MRLVAVLLALFFLSCGESETSPTLVERFDALHQADPSFGALDVEGVRRLLDVAPGEDSPFFMVNFIRYRENAVYADGRETGLSGREADNLYGSQMMTRVLPGIGARVVFAADVDINLQRSDDASWDMVAVVNYPGREAFVSMLESEEFQEIVVHKDAGVADTLVMFASYLDLEQPEDFLALDLASVPMPPAPDDPVTAIIHLYSFREKAEYPDGRPTDLTGKEAVYLYTSNRGEQGVADLGVRAAFWLEIGGNFVSDDRTWHEFRVNLFPSRSTFWQVASTGAEAGIIHRTAGLANVYTLVTRPLLNEYGYREP